ncbi:MAG: hypothetical protein SGBAC_009356 [Bacillariaceae sp.]
MSTVPRSSSGLPCCGIQRPGAASNLPSASSQFVQRQHLFPQERQANGGDLDRDDVEALLVQGIQRLTFDELQREQEELHGVSPELQEDAAVIDGLCNSMKENANRIKRGTAYESAEARNPSYVMQRDFETLFLRANRYDPKAAAEQIIKFFSMKLQLFGSERLVQDITLQDMGEDDMETVMCGSIQVGRCLDRSGRVILLAIPGLRSYQSIENDLRYLHYVFMHTIREYQNKGAIFISYFVGNLKDQKRGDGMSQCVKLIESLPLNISGFHFCFDDPTQLLFAKLAFSAMPPQTRAKTKLHFGSHVECQYLLASYGIPQEALPFSSSSNGIDLSYHTHWVKQRAHRERSGTNPSPSERGASNYDLFPGENDVLWIGRKSSTAGNERLMKMATSFADAYDDGTVKSRRIILSCIVEEIRKHGGRFLKPDTSEEGQGGWVEVEDKEMREKMGQTFRNLRRRRAASKSTGAAAGSNVSSTPVSLSAAVPTLMIQPNDVLFGKNKHHHGNHHLQSLIEYMASDYDSSRRGQKKQLTVSIVCKIKGGGGRFLKPIQDGMWEIVSDEVAEQKVALHFRNFRRKSRPNDALDTGRW